VAWRSRNSQFLKEAIDSIKESFEPVVLITGGAYSGQKNVDAAAEKNIELVTNKYPKFRKNPHAGQRDFIHETLFRDQTCRIKL